ncbi:hypothetical protein CXB51_012295 [Gossypium anomalum]|uniref:Uncharacterized protein n=1 Tax=Gossypium anomalum TaxID=47600 RepID=A0A8J5ZQA5_9ROSI|nr:hypothetical protein CXB51_012295 [Gossypium anomalum]
MVSLLYKNYGGNSTLFKILNETLTPFFLEPDHLHHHPHPYETRCSICSSKFKIISKVKVQGFRTHSLKRLRNP